MNRRGENRFASCACRVASAAGPRSVQLLGGQVGQPVAEQRAELEAVPGRAAADDHVADPADDEVVVRGVVVDAALVGHRVSGQPRQVAADEAGQLPGQVRVRVLVLLVRIGGGAAVVQAGLVPRYAGHRQPVEGAAAAVLDEDGQVRPDGRRGEHGAGQVKVAGLFLGGGRGQADPGRAEQARGPRTGGDDHRAAGEPLVMAADGDPPAVILDGGDPGVLTDVRQRAGQRPEGGTGVNDAGFGLVQDRPGHANGGKPPAYLGGREQFAACADGLHGLVDLAEFGAERELRSRGEQLGALGLLQLGPEVAGLPGQRHVRRVRVAEPEDPAAALRPGGRMPDRGLFQHGDLAAAADQGGRRGQPQQPGTDDHELAVLGCHQRQDTGR